MENGAPKAPGATPAAASAKARQARLHDLPPVIRRSMPILDWGATYTRVMLSGDLVAAVIVTIMLIPQSLAYALLAGLPPEVGLYASILPLVAYALFGSSRTLAVGPVAVISLMTATAVGRIAQSGTADYLTAATLLAFMSGLMLLAMGILRLGLLSNFLSHSVVTGFISASGLLIAAGQIRHLLGAGPGGETLPGVLAALGRQLPGTNPITLSLGVATLAFLVWSRRRLKTALLARGWSGPASEIGARAAPVLAVFATTFATWLFGLEKAGVKIVGTIPQGLPPLTTPSLDTALWQQLAPSAFLIGIVGFVESVSIAQTLAARRRQRIDPNQELMGLGAANVASALTGGYPVTGGFARSVVNFDAGAVSPAAGLFTAVGILLAALLLTPFLYNLPQATLAATIIVAVLSLVDVSALKRTWDYSRIDFAALASTLVVTLLQGVEWGIVTGVLVSIALHLWQTSRPHWAIVGLVPGTNHFRNVDRHAVTTCETVLSLRIDESLYFANARFLEELVAALVAERPRLKHVVLMCPAVNRIDASALESLEAINRNLADGGLTLHLSEVKGPVMDGLKKSHFLEQLTGKVFLSQYDAHRALEND